MPRIRGRRKKKKTGNFDAQKIYIYTALTILLAGLYFFAFASNVNIRSEKCYFFIPDASNSGAVYDSLKSRNLLKYNFSFWVMMKILKLEHPRKGLYQLDRSWGNIGLLREITNAVLPPYMTFQIPDVRSREHMVRHICKQTKTDLKEFNGLLNDAIYLKKLGGYNPESVYSIFIPGKYKIYKHCHAVELLNAIHSEYTIFWNEDRCRIAKEKGYTPEQLTTLASIVYAETKNPEEMPIIAGLYLNRLKKNMRLEADPTVIFATGTYTSRRVYKKHTKHPSTYNTYLYKGLPPGPIGPPHRLAIHAVLHPSEHNYYFFCADEQLTGCHIFSETFEEHKKNAVRYRKVLDEHGIK
jgi:UPF0755 protein